ncbi:MAG: choice-of-anchor L domain-containing protein [Nannocystaceae bacterium]
MTTPRLLLLVPSLVLGCVGDGAGRDGGVVSSGIGSLGEGSASAGSESSGAQDEGGSGSSGSSGDPGGGTGGGPKFDLGGSEGGSAPAGDTGCDSDGCECTIPDHVPCDAGTNDLFRAVGLNCAGELQVQSSTSGPASAMGVRTAFGGTNTYAPREGSLYAVIGSGLVADLDHETPGGDSNAFPTHCNDDIGNFDPGGSLPAPIKTNDVGGDCTGNPALIGTGDCSNTIHGQFSQGGSANDYVEMRFELDVPPDVISFSYDFAFFSTEYPYYFGSEFNDMYIGWLQSELWTGNISFDAMGNPISLNAGFLQYKDDAGNTPELDGTCMRQHAGTDWLTTTAGVMPGEHITVALAIFDLSDSILDSYAFIDNFAWGCDPTGTPSTEPEG